MKMQEAVLEQIRQGKESGISLYLCGVTHIDRFPLFSLDELAGELAPNVILLENRTPESTYQDGTGTGDFKAELETLESSWQSPSLGEVKNKADFLDALVKGIDLPREENDELERKYDLRNDRACSVYESFMQAANVFLYEKPDKLSDSEYHDMEAFQDRMEQTEAGDLDMDSINSVGRKYTQMLSVVKDYSQLHKFMRGEIAELKQLGDSVNGYLEERECFLAESITQVYDGKRVILAAMGGAHLSDDSPLLRFLSGAGIKFAKFFNYKS
jgi:hypothetical protein